jgi:hypothetical protein
MPQEAIITLAAIIGGLGVILGGIIAVYKIARRLDDALAVDENGRSISERISRVEHQVWENGGESLKDKVNEMCEQAGKTATEVTFIKEILLTVIGQAPEAPRPRARKKAAGVAFGLSTFDNNNN